MAEAIASYEFSDARDEIKESRVSDYFALLKPRVMSLVVFTGLVRHLVRTSLAFIMKGLGSRVFAYVLVACRKMMTGVPMVQPDCLSGLVTEMRLNL